MMTPVCPRLLNLNNDFVLLRFWARAPEDLSAIEVIYIIIIIIIQGVICRFCWRPGIHDKIGNLSKHLKRETFSVNIIKGPFTIVNIYVFVQSVLILRPPPPSPN